MVTKGFTGIFKDFVGKANDVRIKNVENGENRFLSVFLLIFNDR
jgi:hypothetical protein